MPYIYDPHANFGYSTVATAPIPAASGTLISVQAGEGARFPAPPFNVTVWPAGVLPTDDNAEIVRVTAQATDAFTIQRAQEGTAAVAIASGYQISNAVTKKMIRDLETSPVPRFLPGGRLTLTSGVPILADAGVSAATTLYYTPLTSGLLELFDGVSLWNPLSFTELSIAVPATVSTGYDIFAYDNAGAATLELTAWTNPTTRATALVRQNGRLVKSGLSTRLYLGSFETTAVAGQTESSQTKRLLSNYYNRVKLSLLKAHPDASWSYGTSTVRQANANAANQVDVFVGVAEALLELELASYADQNATQYAVVGFGEDATNAFVAGQITGSIRSEASGLVNGSQGRASLRKFPAVGRHFYASCEWASGGSFTFYGTPGVGSGPANSQNGITGFIEG